MWVRSALQTHEQHLMHKNTVMPCYCCLEIWVEPALQTHKQRVMHAAAGSSNEHA